MFVTKPLQNGVTGFYENFCLYLCENRPTIIRPAEDGCFKPGRNAVNAIVNPLLPSAVPSWKWTVVRGWMPYVPTFPLTEGSIKIKNKINFYLYLAIVAGATIALQPLNHHHRNIPLETMSALLLVKIVNGFFLTHLKAELWCSLVGNTICGWAVWRGHIN